MGGNLGKNPVIGFFCRTSGNYAEILAGICMAVPVPAVRVAPKLLLVLPENDLCRHFIIVLVNAGHRKGSAGFPAVDRREGDPPSCPGREQVQVIAVGAAFRGIGIVRSVIGNAAFHTIYLLAAPIRNCQHIVPVSVAPGTAAHIHRSIRIVNKVGVRRRRIIMLSVRPHILIAQPGACFLSRRKCERLGRDHPKDAYCAKQKCQQPLYAAAVMGICFLHEISSLS